MGNKHSAPFTDQELADYEQCTVFTKTEILELYKIWKHDLGGDRDKPLEFHVVEEWKSLKVNPFKFRILRVFSSNREKPLFTWDNFVDMCCAFSPRAMFDIKARTAFAMWDVDEDGYLELTDFEAVIGMMVYNQLEHDKVAEVARKMFMEADTDGSAQLTYKEFRNLISRIPDFESKLVFRVF